MIKKNTKVIFKDGENKKIEDMVGGIPLSKGEIIISPFFNAFAISMSDKNIVV